MSASQLIEFTCKQCGNTAAKQKRHLDYSQRHSLPVYCSFKCVNEAKTVSQTVSCDQCGLQRVKLLNEIKRTKHSFCNNSCAAKYNHAHKTKGIRRSKLEVWLEAKLAVLYPDLTILYCDKTAINGELDIYIPSLKLAFELNGIYHYEPIHGQPKLDQVQSNDHRKFQACIEHGIELVIMDTSQLKYFKEGNCLKYLDIVTSIINRKLSLADFV